LNCAARALRRRNAASLTRVGTNELLDFALIVLGLITCDAPYGNELAKPLIEDERHGNNY